MPGASYRISGLGELNRSLSKINRGAAKEVRDALKEAGEPVRQQAETYALGRIGNIGPRWGRVRVGVTTRSVYIAPATRRSGGSPRPNLGVLLLEEALIPAAEEKSDETEHEVLRAFDHLVSSAGFH